MASLALTLAEIKAHVGAAIGVSRDPDDWTGTTVEDDVSRIIRQGKRLFFHPPRLPGQAVAHRWSFLEDYHIFITSTPYETGTIAVVNGVVTLTGGTWPAATQTENSFLVVDGTAYEVDSRDSTTQLTLTDTTLDVNAGESFELIQYRYPLPSNFGGFLEPITRTQRAGFQDPELESTVEYRIRQQYATHYTTGHPTKYAVVSTPNATNGIASWFVYFYPIPSADLELKARYRIEPEDTLDSDDSALNHADPVFADAHLAAILAAAELYHLDKRDVKWEDFLTKIQTAIDSDRQTQGIQRGPRRNEVTNRFPAHLVTAPLVYSSS